VPGKTSELNFFSSSGLALARISPPRGPRSVLCVVVVTGGDQTGNVRHVDEQVRPHRVGNRPAALPVDHPRIGGKAGHQHFRLVLCGERLHVIVVDFAGLDVEPVLHGVVDFAGKIHLRAVG
jgi:hypothetical protein